MRLIVDISEEQYYEITRGDGTAMLVSKQDLINVIREGIPLTQYHGSTYGGESWGGIYRGMEVEHDT